MKWVALLLLLGGLAQGVDRPALLVAGARSCLGDRYDDGYYAGGPPPKGRGACTDVIYAAFLRIGVNLQKAVEADPAPGYYRRDRNIDYRWAPNLVVWFRRHAQSVKDWQPGDVVFWSWSADHVADHCGVVSERMASSGRYLVIHNLGPVCTENDVLDNWEVVGHFRY